jgi:hypothetical protein
MRIPRVQFTLNRMVVLVAFAGLISACCVWRCQRDQYDCTVECVEFGTYVFDSESPVFWAAQWLELAFVFGVVTGFITIIVSIGKAIWHRIARKS